MRTLAEIDADIRRLARPTHPGCAGALHPGVIAKWRAERDAWRAANPDGEARYELLLEEWEATEFAMVRARKAGPIKGIPPEESAALARMFPTTATKGVDAWLSGGKRWLVIGGGTGVGKSVAAAYALTRSPGTGTWLSASLFVKMLGGFDAQQACDRVKHLDVVVVDDFGTEHMSDFAASVFHEVLAARHQNMNRTILTHNLKRDVLRQRLGSRLADRIVSDCVYVECAGESLRGAQ